MNKIQQIKLCFIHYVSLIPPPELKVLYKPDHGRYKPLDSLLKDGYIAIKNKTADGWYEVVLTESGLAIAEKLRKNLQETKDLAWEMLRFRATIIENHQDVIRTTRK